MTISRHTEELEFNLSRFLCRVERENSMLLDRNLACNLKPPLHICLHNILLERHGNFAVASQVTFNNYAVSFI